MYVSIEGQGRFFTIYFPGFVCFVHQYVKISGERLQDHWSSGLSPDSNIWVKCNEIQDILFLGFFLFTTIHCNMLQDAENNLLFQVTSIGK